MIGDKAVEIISENSLDFNVQVRALVNIKELPLNAGELPIMNPDLRYTKFEYKLRYKPSHNWSLKEKPYMITGDIFSETNNHIRFKDYEEFLKKAETVPELKWLMNYSKIDREMFEQARNSLCLPLPVMFDVSKYVKHIKKVYKEQTGKAWKGSVFIDPALAGAEQERLKARDEYGRGKNRVKVGD